MRRPIVALAIATLALSLAVGILIGQMGDGGGGNADILFPEGVPDPSTIARPATAATPGSSGSPIALDIASQSGSPIAAATEATPILVASPVSTHSAVVQASPGTVTATETAGTPAS